MRARSETANTVICIDWPALFKARVLELRGIAVVGRILKST